MIPSRLFHPTSHHQPGFVDRHDISRAWRSPAERGTAASDGRYTIPSTIFVSGSSRAECHPPPPLETSPGRTPVTSRHVYYSILLGWICYWKNYDATAHLITNVWNSHRLPRLHSMHLLINSIEQLEPGRCLYSSVEDYHVSPSIDCIICCPS